MSCDSRAPRLHGIGARSHRLVESCVKICIVDLYLRAGAAGRPSGRKGDRGGHANPRWRGQIGRRHHCGEREAGFRACRRIAGSLWGAARCDYRRGAGGKRQGWPRLRRFRGLHSRQLVGMAEHLSTHQDSRARSGPSNHPHGARLGKGDHHHAVHAQVECGCGRDPHHDDQ